METINHPDMVRGLAKSGLLILAGMTPTAMHTLHMSIGISGEVAELILALSEADNKDIVVSSSGEVLEELGDIEFYLEGLKQGMYPPYPDNVASVVDLDEDIDRSLIVLAGEILDISKKEAIYGQPLKTDKMYQAIADFESRLLTFYSYTGITRVAAKAHNISKLGKRYLDHKYSDKAAEARADKVEEQAFVRANGEDTDFSAT